jgi:hypothetical protein
MLAGLRAAAMAVVVAISPARAATCFDGQVPPAAWAEAAAQAAVRLAAVLPDGRAFASASGMVVADSAVAGGGNRIVTAAHVVRTLRQQPGAWLAVYSSRGAYLGRAAPAAQAAPGPAFGLADGGDAVGLRFGDAAVLRMTGFAPGGARAYAAIAGLPLAPRQPRALLEGVFAAPAGVDRGVSGSGVVADGAIVGIVVFKALDRTMPIIAVSGGDASRPWPAQARVVRLPREARAYAQPVIDSTVLAGLGAAGRAVGKRRAEGTLSVFVPGFVQNACVGFRARMGPA